jgi:hypothetical protein
MPNKALHMARYVISAYPPVSFRPTS